MFGIQGISKRVNPPKSSFRKFYPNKYFLSILGQDGLKRSTHGCTVLYPMDLFFLDTSLIMDN